MSNYEYDVVVLGSGPGGYVAAIRAAQLGLKTAIVERESLGGVCLNWGCIPTKALIHNAEVLETLHSAKEYGFTFDNLTVDFGAAVKRSRGIVGRQTKGVGFLMKKNKIDVINGQGGFTDAHTLQVTPFEPYSADAAPRTVTAAKGGSGHAFVRRSGRSPSFRDTLIRPATRKPLPGTVRRNPSCGPVHWTASWPPLSERRGALSPVLRQASTYGRDFETMRKLSRHVKK